MYPSSYQSSREQFRALSDRVRGRWPGARSISHAPYGDDHTLDAITADAIESPVQRLVITTGEHGIEGCLGAVFLQWFTAEFPALQLYATTLEFGTFGSSLSAGLRTLRALVLENQLHHYGAANDRARQQVLREFAELFMPADAAWQAEAHADARRAVKGILRAEGVC